MKPSEERTSGNSRSRLERHFRVDRRAARREEYIGGEEGYTIPGEPREELLKTFWLANVQQRIMMAEKIRPEDWDRYWSQLEHPVETTGTTGTKT